MDNDYGLDLEEILNTIDTEAVITFRFVIVNQRLLIDTRCSELDGPMIRLVPRARSAEERFRALKQLRPRFKLPERIVAVWWPKYVETLVTTGVWDRIQQRLAATGFPDALEQCNQVLEELRTTERSEVMNAIHGTGYESLWDARR